MRSCGPRSVLEAARGYRLSPAFHLLVGSGLRRGELLALRWQNVNLETGTVTVERSLVGTRTGPVFQEPKTRSGRRTVPLPGPVVRSLKAWRIRWKEERLKPGPGLKERAAARLEGVLQVKENPSAREG